MAAAFEGVVVEISPQLRRLLNGRSILDALERAAPRAMAVVAAELRARAPRGKTGQLGRGFDVDVRRVVGLAGGVQVTIGARVPYGHLVAGGHRIIARGPTRKQVSITTVRISKRTGRQVVSTRLGIDPTSRLALRRRRALGSTRFVPGNPFVQEAFAAREPEVVNLLERLIGQELSR